MGTLLDAEGNLFDLQGIHTAVEHCTDDEFETLTGDYILGLEAVAAGNTEIAARCGLGLLETLLEIETRLRNERQKMAA